MSVLWYHLNKIIEQERDRLFLWFPVFFATGIALYFGLNFEPSIWWSLIVVETLVVLAYVWRHKANWLAFLACFSVVVLGFVNIQVRAYHLSKIPLLQEEKVLYLKGYVAASGYNYRGRPYLILDHLYDFDNKELAGKYRVTVLNKEENIAVGDCVETVASLRPLMSPILSNGYQFNRQQYFQGLKGTGYTDVSVHKISCADIGVHQGYFLPLIDRLRTRLVGHIYRLLPPETAGIAAAIIAGERGKITPRLTAEYRDAGLAHFLAISGLHMGMLAGLMFVLVRWVIAYIPSVAVRYDSRKIAAVVAMIMSFIYLIISGWQISTQRAFMMTFLVLLGVCVGRMAISMRMAAWAAMVILILEPQVLLSPGFQMSFAAVIMLIAFYERYSSLFRLNTDNKQLFRLWRWGKIIVFYLMGIVVADFIASMATLPFVIYHFNRISLYTSLANLLAGPIIGLWIMPAVLLSFLLLPFGADKYALYIVSGGIEQVNKIVSFVSHLDYASYQIVSMPTWGLLLIVLGGLWLTIWQTRWRHWGWFLILGGYLSILTIKTPDVLTDQRAKTFALKDSSGEMFILPNRGNYFTKQLWQEKLAIPPLSDDEKEEIKAVYKGKQNGQEKFFLECSQFKCSYKERITLYKKGGIKIDDIDYAGIGALEIYIKSDKIKIFPVKNEFGHRYWGNF